MSRVSSEVLASVNHKPLASEKVYSQRDALHIYIFLRAFLKVLSLLEALRASHALLEHLPVLLAKLGVLLMVWLKVLLPDSLYSFSHFNKGF